MNYARALNNLVGSSLKTGYSFTIINSDRLFS